MEAERCRADIVIALVKIEIEGPRIVHDTFRRFYGHLQAKQQQQYFNNDNDGRVHGAFEP
jgi:hypothetical protein